MYALQLPLLSHQPARGWRRSEPCRCPINYMLQGGRDRLHREPLDNVKGLPRGGLPLPRHRPGRGVLFPRWRSGGSYGWTVPRSTRGSSTRRPRWGRCRRATRRWRWMPTTSCRSPTPAALNPGPRRHASAPRLMSQYLSCIFDGRYDSRDTSSTPCRLFHCAQLHCFHDAVHLSGGHERDHAQGRHGGDDPQHRGVTHHPHVRPSHGWDRHHQPPGVLTPRPEEP